MADKVTVKMTPDSRDLKSLYKAFREMDEGAKKALKDDVTSISAWSATELQSSYTFNPLPAQAQKVAATIRANKDRIPNVTIGGSKGRFSGGAVSGQVLFGSEFGGPAPLRMVVDAFLIAHLPKVEATRATAFSSHLKESSQN